MKKPGIFLLCGMIILGAVTQPALAFFSLHPIQMYDKGERLLKEYDGNMQTLVAAQDVFVRLIIKYPHSPFGYLGMSHIYRIDACLGEEDYDIEIIRERALPFALRAMELGPSIREVHENYAFFEKFFKDGEGPSRLDFSP